MAIPPTITRLIAEAGGLALPGVLAEVLRCEGAKFHSPSPLLLDNYVLADAKVFRVEDYSGDGPYTSIWLCGTCKDNLSVLLGLLHAHHGDLPWEARREFGNLIRAIGLTAWRDGKRSESA